MNALKNVIMNTLLTLISESSPLVDRSSVYADFGNKVRAFHYTEKSERFVNGLLVLVTGSTRFNFLRTQIILVIAFVSK